MVEIGPTYSPSNIDIKLPIEDPILSLKDQTRNFVKPIDYLIFGSKTFFPLHWLLLCCCSSNPLQRAKYDKGVLGRSSSVAEREQSSHSFDKVPFQFRIDCPVNWG